jgi:hypothetical protein
VPDVVSDIVTVSSTSSTSNVDTATGNESVFGTSTYDNDIEMSEPDSKVHVNTTGGKIEPIDEMSVPETTCDIGALQTLHMLDTRKLESGQKYRILEYEHPKEETLYPTTLMNGCMRRFKPSWLTEHSWLHYSWHCDGVWCKACALFSPVEVSSNKLGLFVCNAFTKWTKKSEAFRNHASSEYHLDAIAVMSEFKSVIENPDTAIDRMLDTERIELAARNRHVLATFFDIALLCGRQGLAFRGHRDDKIEWEIGNNNTVPLSDDANVGNFIELVRFRAQSDPLLTEHLASAPRNAQYTSKTIQNELIDVIGDTMRENLLREIKQAKFFSVMADEVTDVSNREQVSVVIRYVNANLEVKEVYLDLVCTERITGAAMATLITTRLSNWELSLANLRGQAYDGASNMAGKKNGCQALIKANAPLAFYTHCASHQLSLAVVSSCNIVAVKNAHSTIGEISRFFSFSPKRNVLFDRVVDLSEDALTAHKLKDVCRTRWIERVEAYETFFSLFASIVTAMQAMSAMSDYPQFGTDWAWDSDTVTRAQGFLHILTSPTFIVAGYLVMDLLSLLHAVTVKLQGRCTDILQAYDLVWDVALDFHLMRMNVDEEFAMIFEEIERRAEEVGVEITVPRVVGRQSHRANTPSSNPQEYFRRTVMIPLLDHLTTELGERFSNEHKKVVQIIGLVPACIANSYAGFQLAVPEQLTELVKTYKNDLPVPDLFHVEYASWVRHWQRQLKPEKLPNSLQDTLRKCDCDRFRNIFVLLKLALTMPVTTCENERSHSQLKLVKTYLRSTMTEERLGSLMLMKVHRQLAGSLSNDVLVDAFEQKHPRRMLLKCLLSTDDD